MNPELREFIAGLRAKNGKRPCDCTSCDCGNSGDTYSVGSWDGTEWALKELESLVPSQAAQPQDVTEQSETNPANATPR